MKKIILTLAAVVLSAGVMSAQDLAAATEVYNSGATALAAGNKADAVKFFSEALKLANGAEGAEEIISTCQGTIPKLLVSIAKELIEKGQYDEAVVSLEKAIKTSNEYKEGESAKEAGELILQVYMQKANDLFKNKNYAEAAKSYQKILDIVPAENPLYGSAALNLGQSLSSIGKVDEAVKAFTIAAETGDKETASKKISTIFLKKAQTALKGNKFNEAIEFAEKSNSYVENANAYKIAAFAYQKNNNKKATIENFEKYLSLAGNAKDIQQIQFTLGVLYQQTGVKEKAIEYYQKVLNNPQFSQSAKQQLEALTK